MTNSSRRIVFLGTHGQFNIGDELLLETFLTQLGDQHHYVVNSYDVDVTTRQLSDRFDVEVIHTGRDRARLLRELRRSDLLCFGGGSIIKELYASTGRNRYATLAMILGVVTFAKRVARKPVAMLSVGVGPIQSQLGRWLARRILSQVDLLTVRDAKSRETCRRLGVQTTLVPDAVFSVDERSLLAGPVEAGATPTPPASPADRPPALRVAINLNFDIENPDQWEPFLERLTRALELVHAEHPLVLHALPMQIGFKAHDDAEVLLDLAGRLSDVPFVMHTPRTPADAARLIRSCDLLLSERLHAIIMASILSVPPFVLAYDVKVRELAATLGLEPWSIDINRPFDAEELTSHLRQLIARRAEVSTHVTERSTALRGLAIQSFERARAWVSSAGEETAV